MTAPTDPRPAPPPLRCPYCAKAVEGPADPTSSQTPAVGDAFVCFDCLGGAIFDGPAGGLLRLRRMSPAERVVSARALAPLRAAVVEGRSRGVLSPEALVAELRSALAGDRP